MGGSYISSHGGTSWDWEQSGFVVQRNLTAHRGMRHGEDAEAYGSCDQTHPFWWRLYQGTQTKAVQRTFLPLVTAHPFAQRSYLLDAARGPLSPAGAANIPGEGSINTGEYLFKMLFAH